MIFNAFPILVFPSCFSGLSPDHCFPEHLPVCPLLSLPPFLPHCGQAYLQSVV